MGQFLRNLSDGSLRCRYCGDKVCSCMEEGFTELGFVTIWHETENAILIQFRKQKLSGGKKIPSKVKLWVLRIDVLGGYDETLKTIKVNNIAINKWVFD